MKNTPRMEGHRMSILGSLGGALLAQFEGANGSTAITTALESSGLGGLDGIVSKLKEGGLEEHVQSWIGGGENLPITAEQLQAVLGDTQVQQIAAHFGIPVDAAMGLLAQHLPAAVDQANPGGTPAQAQ
jgi:uncharacterized protein YidB (DUF937 family)